MNASQPDLNRNEEPLSSWKEIGAYLQRNEATAPRWEREEGLPVHRHSHKIRSSVYAYPSELDAWRASRKLAPPPAAPWWRPLAFGVTALLCLMMVGNGLRPQLASAQQALQTARQVWASNEGFVDVDSISQDGRYLTGSDWETGDVTVRDLATSTTRRVTHDGLPAVKGGFSEDSIVSPDSRQVAYHWYNPETKRAELRMVEIDGAETPSPRVVHSSAETDYIDPLGFTPDGKQVLVIRTLQDQTNQIAMVSLQDKSLRVLKSLGWWYPDMSLSPDGRFIAYEASTADLNGKASTSIAVLAVDGGSETLLEPKSAEDSSPLWSPDGNRLVFVSNRTGTNSLWTIPVRAGKPSGPAEVLKADIGPMRPLGIAKSGTLYYTQQEDRRNVYVAELNDAKKVTKDPARVSERFLNSNGRGAWSRDGKFLAYYSFRTASRNPSRPATLVIRIEATGEERDIPLPGLVPIHSFAAPPRWFPDGGSVLVAALRAQQPGVGYYRVDLASGKAEPLQHTLKWGVAAEPDLSPDGKTIFYAHQDAGTAQLMRFEIASRRETKLLTAEGLVSPTVSPDGTQLAYLQKGSIRVMPASGGESREVYRAPGTTSEQSTVTWMPDRKDLLFIQSSGFSERDKHVLWRIPLNGGPAEQVGVERKGGYPFTPAVHPDGRKIVFESHDGAGFELWALENLLLRASK